MVERLETLVEETKDEMVMEDFDMNSLYEESFSKYQEGEIIEGTIIGFTDREVIVDVGYKSEGLIPRSEFLDLDALQVGETVEVFLETKEDEHGMVILSKKKAERTKGWERLIQKYNEGDVIEGKIVKCVKGGYTVNIGVEAFLPSSQSGIKLPQDRREDFLNKALSFKIIKINKPRKNVVLSRKDVIQKEKDKAREHFISSLEKDMICKGKVKNITDFGAFINLGEIDGLLHITDMKWGRIKHPSEMLKIGDETEVKILDIDFDNKKVSLGLKQKTESPWKQAEQKYPVGTKVKGKVVNIVPYGAFIELDDGIEGLVHISELSWTKRITHPQDILALNDEVESIVLSIDGENEKLSLGIKQTETNPWQSIDEKYPIEASVKGKVKSFVDYGVFIEIEEGIEGLLHISDISWTKKIENISEMYSVGAEIDVKVLDIDKGSRKISLGVKQLTQDPWNELFVNFPEGTTTDGKITKVTKFGIFVQLENGIEGLIHISEAGIDPESKLEDFFKPSEPLNVKILKIDNDNRKISLSLKQKEEVAVTVEG